MNDGQMKKKVLVVDDAFVNRALLKKIFSEEFDVLEAENGRQALEILESHPETSVVILDIVMPEMDGFEVLRVMKENSLWRGIPVIVDTSCDDVENQLRMLDQGAVDVLIKPINSRIVLHRVKNILNRLESDRKAAHTAALEQQLKLSEIDEKSHIYNRQAFCRKTTELLRKHPDEKFVLLRWDIDRFKVYNDVFGIAAGDNYLATIGSIYKKKAKGEMTYGRWEADHFVTCISYNRFLSDDIEAGTKEFKLFNENIDFVFMPRMGVYVIDDPNTDVVLMCDRALLALRSIKDNYSEHVAFYDESMRSTMIEEQEIVGEMNSALEHGEFVVYLQPQYNYAKKALRGAEALIRWVHPKKGIISPIRFIPIFERNGFITKVDKFVWEEVCKLQRKWLDEGISVVPISVNVSRRDIYNPKLCALIVSLIKKYELTPDMLHLEITESAYVEDPEQLIKTVIQLQAAGFSVEMDDFGSGYSSLNTLKDVPVDLLKLDIMFLQNSANNKRSGSILTSVIRMANWLKLPVIAEGVETKEQAEYLESVGCLYMQGYYYARPMPVSDYKKVLTESMLDNGTDSRFSGDVEGAADFLSASTQATLLFNSFVGGAAILEYDGNNVEALRMNDKYFEVIGTTRESYKGKQLKILERFDEKNKALFLQMIHRAIETREESGCELSSLPLNEHQDPIWLSIQTRLLAQNANRYILYVSVLNTSQKMQLLIKNVKLNDQLTAIMDSVPGGILNLEIKQDMTITYFNDIAASMFGYTRDEYADLFLKQPLTAIHPEDRENVNKKVIEVIREELSYVELVFRHICKDGSWRWVRYTGHSNGRENHVMYATGFLMDIDKQVHSEQIAEKQREEINRQRISLKTLYNTISCGIMQLSLPNSESDRYNILGFNDTMWRIYGYHSREQYIKEVQEKGQLKDIYKDDLQEVKYHIQQICHSNRLRPIDCDHRIVLPDGSIRWVRALFQKVRYENKEEILQVVVTDITEHKQEDLQRLNGALFRLYDKVYEFDTKQNLIFMRASIIENDKRIGKIVPFDQYLNDVCNQLVIPEDRDKVKEFYKEISSYLKKGQAELEFRCLGENHEERWISTIVLHLEGFTYLSCIHDMTEIKNAQKLTKENDMLQALMNEQTKKE